jgi:hypothetical protein
MAGEKLSAVSKEFRADFSEPWSSEYDWSVARRLRIRPFSSYSYQYF